VTGEAFHSEVLRVTIVNISLLVVLSNPEMISTKFYEEYMPTLLMQMHVVLDLSI
jgi:hypothetical protein